MEQRSFASPEEEIQYLKNRVVALEHKLETQLEQSEAKIKEFRSLTNRLQHENDQLKDKLEQCHKEYHFQVRIFKCHFNFKF